MVMVLGGLWHGASWNYAIWGLLHGLALAVERLIIGNSSERTGKLFFIVDGFRILLVFSVVTLAWSTFIISDFDNLLLFYKSLFENYYIKAKLNRISTILTYSFPVILMHVFYLIHLKIENSKMVIFLKEVGYGIMLFLIITNSGTSGEFIYFQF
jgi:alginate O-acetyltransferase complex protein AlgI